MPDSKLFGKDIKRLEDPILLRGEAHFVDDICLPEMAHACFVRSPFAHALVKGINASAAQEMEGVVAVLTLADLRPQLVSELLVVGLPSPSYRQESDRPVLASEEVCYVGEPVAVVIAKSRHIAEDAAAIVDVDTNPYQRSATVRSHWKTEVQQFEQVPPITLWQSSYRSTGM